MLPHFLGVRQNLSETMKILRLNVVATVCCEYVLNKYFVLHLNLYFAI